MHPIVDFKVLVISSPSETGGPHLLHQLVHHLRNNRINAFICYTNNSTYVTKAYRHYNVDVGRVFDSEDEIIILPESQTDLYFKFNNAKKVIWWLSVDHYLGYSEINSFRRFYSYFRHNYNLFFKKKINLYDTKTELHLYQSEYARIFLSSYGINSYRLSDYLGSSFLTSSNIFEKEKYTICFNPKKGAKWINKLVKYFPKKYKFIALIGMSEAEVSETLKKSMVYIDFGNHPGKDRIPREAAMSGCVVITNRRGSADNNLDIPINDNYKFNNLNINSILNLCEDIVTNFDFHFNKFENYRSYIQQEQFVFESDVKKLIDLLTRL